MNKKVYDLTQEGIDNLKAELANLKDELIPANIEALKAARSQGDLSENADYDAARDEQSRLDARVKEIENILKNVRLIEKDNSKEVSTGKHVNITYIALNKTFEYHIVGTIEANPMEGKISNEAPLGKALLGKSKGDIVTVVTETGKELKVKINDVK